MKTIYLDSDFKCHAIDTGGLNPVETDAFDGKCDNFIEGYRFIPDSKSWTRQDGTVFYGEMIAPFMDYRILSAYQEQYQESAADLKAAQKETENLQSKIAEMDAEYRKGVNSV